MKESRVLHSIVGVVHPVDGHLGLAGHPVTFECNPIQNHSRSLGSVVVEIVVHLESKE
jgi:hypothetical protein